MGSLRGTQSPDLHYIPRIWSIKEEGIYSVMLYPIVRVKPKIKSGFPLRIITMATDYKPVSDDTAVTIAALFYSYTAALMINE